MFHDSNTADPYTPPIIDPTQPSNGNGGSGNGEDPPPEVTRAIDRLVVTGQVTSFSKEGMPPVTAGATVNVWYKDGTVVAAAAGDLFTVPAILGQAQINTVSPTQALPVAISVYHKDDPTKFATVMLPGVNALVVSGRGLAVASVSPGSANVATGWGNVHVVSGGAIGGTGTNQSPAAVFGAGQGKNMGVSIAASTTVAGSYYQDAALPAFSYPTVYVKYQGLTDFSKTWRTGSAANASATGTGTSLYLWEEIKLDERYIFADYNASFSNLAVNPTVSGTTRTEAKRYAYGIDYDNKYVYFLISRGLTHGMTAAGAAPTTPPTGYVNPSKAANNSSIYVRVPWHDDNFNFYYVRAVEVDNLDWESSEPAKHNFLTQAEALRITNWKTEILKADRNIRLKVYFDDQEEPQIRGRDFLVRADQLGELIIIGDTKAALSMDSGDDGFGELKIGYYPARRNTNTLNPVDKGDFENFAAYPLPIAIYNQGSGKFVKQSSASEPGPLVFYAGTAGWANNAIDGSQLIAVQNTYDFVGTFTIGNQTVDGVVMPGSDFETGFFPDRNALRVTEKEDKDVTFRIPNNIARTHAYYFFRGEEAEFTVTVYPADGK